MVARRNRREMPKTDTPEKKSFDDEGVPVEQPSAPNETQENVEQPEDPMANTESGTDTNEGSGDSPPIETDQESSDPNGESADPKKSVTEGYAEAVHNLDSVLDWGDKLHHLKKIRQSLRDALDAAFLDKKEQVSTDTVWIEDFLQRTFGISDGNITKEYVEKVRDYIVAKNEVDTEMESRLATLKERLSPDNAEADVEGALEAITLFERTLMDEQVRFRENLPKGWYEKVGGVVGKFWNKLGDMNVSTLFGYEPKDTFKGKLGYAALRALSVRTIIMGGLVTAGFLTGGVVGASVATGLRRGVGVLLGGNAGHQFVRGWIEKGLKKKVADIDANTDVIQFKKECDAFMQAQDSTYVSEMQGSAEYQELQKQYADKIKEMCANTTKAELARLKLNETDVKSRNVLKNHKRNMLFGAGAGVLFASLISPNVFKWVDWGLENAPLVGGGYSWLKGAVGLGGGEVVKSATDGSELPKNGTAPDNDTPEQSGRKEGATETPASKETAADPHGEKEGDSDGTQKQSKNWFQKFLNWSQGSPRADGPGGETPPVEKVDTAPDNDTPEQGGRKEGVAETPVSESTDVDSKSEKEVFVDNARARLRGGFQKFLDRLPGSPRADGPGGEAPPVEKVGPVTQEQEGDPKTAKDLLDAFSADQAKDAGEYVPLTETEEFRDEEMDDGATDTKPETDGADAPTLKETLDGDDFLTNERGEYVVQEGNTLSALYSDKLSKDGVSITPKELAALMGQLRSLEGTDAGKQLLERFGISSGNIDLIHPGDTIDTGAIQEWFEVEQDGVTDAADITDKADQDTSPTETSVEAQHTDVGAAEGVDYSYTADTTMSLADVLANNGVDIATIPDAVRDVPVQAGGQVQFLFATDGTLQEVALDDGTSYAIGSSEETLPQEKVAAAETKGRADSTPAAEDATTPEQGTKSISYSVKDGESTVADVLKSVNIGTDNVPDSILGNQVFEGQEVQILTTTDGFLKGVIVNGQEYVVDPEVIYANIPSEVDLNQMSVDAVLAKHTILESLVTIDVEGSASGSMSYPDIQRYNPTLLEKTFPLGSTNEIAVAAEGVAMHLDIGTDVQDQYSTSIRKGDLDTKSLKEYLQKPRKNKDALLQEVHTLVNAWSVDMFPGKNAGALHSAKELLVSDLAKKDFTGLKQLLSTYDMLQSGNKDVLRLDYSHEGDATSLSITGKFGDGDIAVADVAVHEVADVAEKGVESVPTDPVEMTVGEKFTLIDTLEGVVQFAETLNVDMKDVQESIHIARADGTPIMSVTDLQNFRPKLFEDDAASVESTIVKQNDGVLIRTEYPSLKRFSIVTNEGIVNYDHIREAFDATEDLKDPDLILTERERVVREGLTALTVDKPPFNLKMFDALLGKIAVKIAANENLVEELFNEREDGENSMRVSYSENQKKFSIQRQEGEKWVPVLVQKVS